MKRNLYSESTVLPDQAHDLKDDSISQLLVRIINSANYFERLDLPVKLHEPQSIRLSYRKLALLIHPDKCAHHQSTLAFQLVSVAFETLYDRTSQERYVLSLSISAQKKQKTPNKNSNNKSRQSTSPSQKNANRAKAMPTFDEMMADLRAKEEHETVMMARFQESVKAKLDSQRTKRDCASARRICEQLDTQKGILENPLWFQKEGGNNTLEQSPGALLTELIAYLRVRHCYCIYCGVEYLDEQDLSRHCPGIDWAAHES